MLQAQHPLAQRLVRGATALVHTLCWPTTVTAKPKTSRQKQKPHGKTKNLSTRPKTSRQNQKLHGKSKIPHGKTKNLTAKPKTSRQNQIPHSKNQILHGKTKYPRQNQSYLFLLWIIWFCRAVFGFAVSYFVFAVRFLVLLWRFCFCREVFGFAVTVVGHHISLPNLNSLISWLISLF